MSSTAVRTARLVRYNDRLRGRYGKGCFVKIALVGFGTVGQGLAQILHEKAHDLRQEAAFAPTIVAVATRSRGALHDPHGLKPDNLLRAMSAGGLDQYPAGASVRRMNDIRQLIAESGADVLVEASATDLQSAQPALDYCKIALEHGQHLVLANKGPVALAYAELSQLSRQKGRHFRFEGTVMAGTPSLTLAREALKGCQIREARGILNGTTNYILTQMESGLGYQEALSQAQQLGYAEADPTADVDGWDAAGKLLILSAAVMGVSLRLSDIAVKGISQISARDVDEARKSGERWKLIAHATRQGTSVQPLRLPLNDPLAGVSGATNAITYETDLLGAVTLIGPGAGRLQTGFALLADLLAIHRLEEFGLSNN